MNVLRTNALPCEEDSDIFGGENLQVYVGYNFDQKTDRGIMEINVVKLRVTLN
jgi:hypothetical protein